MTKTELSNMDNRELLLRVINGGEARSSILRVLHKCRTTGETSRVSEEAIGGDIDITINVVYDSEKQLELQKHLRE